MNRFFQVLPIAGDEQIASVLAVDDFREDEYLVLLTQVRSARSSATTEVSRI